MNTNLATALGLAAIGIHVFPCQEDKKPCSGIRWRQQSTTDENFIRNWWAIWPSAVPAIDLAKCGLVVIDLDKHDDGPDGQAEFIALAKVQNDLLSDMPVVETPNRGFHLYYRQPDGVPAYGNAEGALKGKGINVRGFGGYVIAPGARRTDGSGWISSRVMPDLIDAFKKGVIPTLPLWVQNLIGEERKLARPKVAPTNSIHSSSREHAYAKIALHDEAVGLAAQKPGSGRNIALNRSAFSLGQIVGAGWIEREVVQQALWEASASNGYRAKDGDKAAWDTLQSGLAAGIQQPRTSLTDKIMNPARSVEIAGAETLTAPLLQSVRPQKQPGRRLRFRRVSDVQSQPIRWLWKNRVAYGKLTIIAGDPGLGKSQLAMLIAAIVSSGSPWPNSDERPAPRNVLVLSCEDDLEDTIRPRLQASGADLSRIEVLEGAETGQNSLGAVSLLDDLPELEKVIVERNIGLLIVDPITAYLDKIDTHKTSDVRSALAPLQSIASRNGVAVLAISHLNKNNGNGKAINAVTGSGAFVAASRFTFLVARGESEDGLRLFVLAKTNHAKAPGLMFRVVPVTLAPGIETSHIKFESGTVDITADVALGNHQADPSSSARQEAKQFLLDRLRSGPVAARELEEEATAASISKPTLHRAKKDLRLVATKSGFQGAWSWALPEFQARNLKPEGGNGGQT